jgi:hypothetical protein
MPRDSHFRSMQRLPPLRSLLARVEPAKTLHVLFSRAEACEASRLDPKYRYVEGAD